MAALDEDKDIIRENKPSSLGNCEDSMQDDATVEKIKRKLSLDKEFELVYATAKGVNQTIESLNVNKAKGPDGIFA